MKAQDRFIKDWMSSIRMSRLALPRFQRHETWGPGIITAFLTSIVRQLPVGVCLILEVGNEPQFQCRYLSKNNTEGKNVKDLLLDGQQRLTALWKSLNDVYDDRTYLLDLETKEDEDISVIGIGRWINKKNNKRYPLWVDDPKECWKRKKIPIKILNPDDEEEVYDWIEEATNNIAEEYKNLSKVASKYRLNMSTFNIPYLALDSDTSPAVAIEVFIKLNTSYVKLTAFDIIVAQVEELTDISLHNKVATLTTEVPEISDYINTENFVLSVSALLQNRLPNQRGYFNLDLKRMINEWDKVIKGSKELIKLLEEQKIFDSERLPTETILAPLTAILAEAPDAPDARGNLLIFLRSYMWRAFFTNRYDRSIPTRILQDFRGTKKYFAGSAKLEEIPIFDEKQFPLPSEEMLANTGWPKKKDRLARAILLLSFKKGAIDFADNSHISKKNIKLREYHHIFPVNLLKNMVNLKTTFINH